MRQPMTLADLRADTAFPAGSEVDVWTGAFTGSPGTPPLGTVTTVRCRIDHWNSVGQAYVKRVDGQKIAGVNHGAYVFGSAIVVYAA